MNETELLKNIKNIIGDEYIGDDCAYLKELNIVVSQDSLVENIHFKRSWYTPEQLGYKSVAVNISDILSSGAEPKYITIALSLPNDTNQEFVTSFYKGAQSALKGAKIVGGDITGSKKDIMISITAIGSALNRNISSRKYAKEGYVIITKGNFGSSAAGLEQLINNGSNKELINAHITPVLEYDFAEKISTTVKENYAMMDSSDGLGDALFKIAEESNVKIIADIDKVPHLKNVSKNQILFGGEDYKIVAAIPPKYLKKIPGAVVIGKVLQYDGSRLVIDNRVFKEYNELNTYDHFKEN